MSTIATHRYNKRVSQGDVYRDVYCYENISEGEGAVKVERILFPYVIVLTQDCDLQQHDKYVNVKSGQLFSIVVAPIYNMADFMNGEHLLNLGLEATSFISNKGKSIITTQKVNSNGQLIAENQVNRFHSLVFSRNNNDILPPGIVDFKHYFTVGINYLKKEKSQDFVCRLLPLYRELLTQRFSNYLSRIGLPNPKIHS